MIDLNHCNEWQHRCPETGLVLPWYTKSFLDELVTWKLSDKAVLELGMGASTLWWQRKATYLTAIDSNPDWYSAVIMNMENKPGDEYLVQSIEELENKLMEMYDIAIIDIEPIEWRDACVQPALDCLKPGGKLIIDNWMQPSVWMPSKETQQLLSKYPVQVYPQEGHPDWKTAVFTKTKNITYKQLCQEYKELRAKAGITMGDEQLTVLSRLKEIDKQLKQMDAALGRFTGGSTNYKGDL